jgi:DNA-binding response OmpR family regulator
MINDSHHITDTHSSINGNSLQKSQSATSEKLSSFTKRILIVDDDPDIIFTFKKGLEAENEKSSNKVFFKVNSYNDPLLALSEFKSDLYDLILIDINMPKMDGVELSSKISELDANVKICLVTAGEANVEVLRELYPTRGIGCFIKKPITIENLIRRIKTELG